MSDLRLSVISPVYQAEEIIEKLVKEIENACNQITNDYEIILVEDGSVDNSWQMIKNLIFNHSKLKAIQLSRNFGQHAAIHAGLKHAKGDLIVVMDCDLQDKPSEIIKLYNKTKEGYKIVLAARKSRQDNYYKKLCSKIFYKILSYLTGIKQDPEIANFGIYHYTVIEAILSMNDYIRCFPAMVKWVGFKSFTIKVEHANRYSGHSSYSFKKLFNLALQIIISFSDKPLRLTIKAGLMISFCSFIFAIYIISRYFLGTIDVLGYSSIMVSIWFFGGLIITLIGILGLYIGRIFEEVKNRPIYICDKKINF